MLLGVYDKKIYFLTDSGIFRTVPARSSGLELAVSPPDGKDIRMALMNPATGQIVYATADATYLMDQDGYSMQMTDVPDVYATCAAISPDGSRMAVGTLNNGIIADGITISDLPSIIDMTYSQDGALYALTDSRMILGIRDGQVTDSISVPHNLARITCSDGSLYGISLASGIEVYSTAPLTHVDRLQGGLRFAPDGTTLCGEQLWAASGGGVMCIGRPALRIALPHVSPISRAAAWRFPAGLLLLTGVGFLILFIISQMILSPLRRSRLRKLMMMQEMERCRKEAKDLYAIQLEDLSSASRLHAMIYPGILMGKATALFRDETSSIEEMTAMNAIIETWRKQNVRFRSIAQQFKSLGQFFGNLPPTKPVNEINARTSDAEDLISSFCNFQTAHEWESGMNRLETMFSEMCTNSERLCQELAASIEDIITRHWNGSALAEEIRSRCHRIALSMAGTGEIDALVETGRFMSQLPAIEALCAAEQAASELDNIPRKVRQDFLDERLSKKDSHFKAMSEVRSNFEASVREFYQLIDETEMQCLKHCLGISQKSSHKAQLFLAMLAVQDCDDREKLYLLHGDTDVNRQETTNSRRGEIRRALAAVRPEQYADRLSLMAMLILILHKRMMA